MNDDDLINEILAKSKPKSKKAPAKRATDAAVNRAKPHASSRDASYIRAKMSAVPKQRFTADFGAARDPGDAILRHMRSAPADSTKTPDTGGPADTRIIKTEAEDGQITRAVLDLKRKTKIGEAS